MLSWLYIILNGERRAPSSLDASVFTEAACVNLTNGICSSSFQDSANQPHQFSIFPICGHRGQIPELVGGCSQTNTRVLMSGKKKKKRESFVLGVTYATANKGISEMKAESIVCNLIL